MTKFESPWGQHAPELLPARANYPDIHVCGRGDGLRVLDERYQAARALIVDGTLGGAAVLRIPAAMAETGEAERMLRRVSEMLFEEFPAMRTANE